jgi:hypothetical protein
MVAPGDTDLRWGGDVLRRASSADPAQQTLEELVRFLDQTIDTADEVISFRLLLLARAVAAAGRALLAREPMETVERTVAAADAYALAPSDASYDAYLAAATASYPYGAGDGCYAIDVGKGCGAGSGCRTGAGTLVQIGHRIGAERTLSAIVEELAPWLERFQLH